MPHRVFVYGTLKRGERNHFKMGTSRFVRPAVTALARFTMHEYDSISRPGHLVPDVREGGIHRIAGELFEVDDAILAELDLFERVGVDYLRKAIELDRGEQAQIYLHAPQSLRPAKPSLAQVKIEGDVASWSERQGDKT